MHALTPAHTHTHTQQRLTSGSPACLSFFLVANDWNCSYTTLEGWEEGGRMKQPLQAALCAVTLLGDVSDVLVAKLTPQLIVLCRGSEC